MGLGSYRNDVFSWGETSAYLHMDPALRMKSAFAQLPEEAAKLGKYLQARGCIGTHSQYSNAGRAGRQENNGLILGTRNYPPLGKQLGP